MLSIPDVDIFLLQFHTRIRINAFATTFSADAKMSNQIPIRCLFTTFTGWELIRIFGRWVLEWVESRRCSSRLSSLMGAGMTCGILTLLHERRFYGTETHDAFSHRYTLYASTTIYPIL